MQGAVCLDGSPPGYYFHPGTGSGANKWLLHLKGGGWCFEGIESCYNRSFTTLGTSNNWTSTIMLDGALSPDQASNPAFYNWNIVYFMYCDGASFSADRYICMHGYTPGSRLPPHPSLLYWVLSEVYVWL